MATLLPLISDRLIGNILLILNIQFNGQGTKKRKSEINPLAKMDWHMNCIEVANRRANPIESETCGMHPRKRNHSRKSVSAVEGASLSLRLLKKELKLIPIDLKREMRFLDLLLVEYEHAKTQAEKDVIRDFLAGSRARVEYHQKRLERYEECYRQLKETKGCDTSLLLPEELHRLQPSQEGFSSSEAQEPGLRTGTHG